MTQRALKVALPGRKEDAGAQAASKSSDAACVSLPLHNVDWHACTSLLASVYPSATTQFCCYTYRSSMACDNR